MSQYRNRKRMWIAPAVSELIVATIILSLAGANVGAHLGGDSSLSATAWPPDSARVERLVATGNLEECLEYVKALAVEAEQHYSGNQHLHDAEALARMAAITASVTGDYLGLMDIFTPLASSPNRRARLAGRLVLGSIFASGIGEFPTWRDAAATELTAVAMSNPFSTQARAARSIGREYGIKIQFMPIWMWLGAIVAVIAVFLVILSASKAPRLYGRLALSSDSKSRVAPTISRATFNLSQDVGKRKGLVFFVSDGMLRHDQYRGDFASFLAKRDSKSASGVYKNVMFAIFPATGGHMLLWADSGGTVSHDGIALPFFSDTEVESDCDIIVSGITLQFTGIRR